jgi:prefoldin alpha subunit
MMQKKGEISEEDLRNLYFYYSLQLSSLSKLREGILKQIEELEETIETINGIEQVSDQNLFLNIGEGFVEVKKAEKNFLINIGNEYFQEKTREEAIQILQERQKKLEQNKKEVETKILQLQNLLQNLEEALRGVEGNG